jgi:hypothetical protein
VVANEVVSEPRLETRHAPRTVTRRRDTRTQTH